MLSLLLDSRLYTTMKAMARKTAETASRIETATIEVRQAKVALRSMLVKKLCTFGLGGAPDAKIKYAKARDRLERLRVRHEAQAVETTALKQLLVTYVQGASRTMKSLSRTLAALLREEFNPGCGKTASMAALTFTEGLKSLKIGSPTDEKFWQIVLAQGLRDVALARCAEIADKLNTDCKAAYKGFVPQMLLEATHGKFCVDLRVATPDARPNIFAEPFGLMLENIEAHAGRFHSLAEKTKAKAALAALNKMPEPQPGSAEMKCKLLAADHLERLKGLRRKERYRIKPEPVRNLLPDYEAFLAGLDPDDSRRVEYVMELANLIPPMATGLMQLDEGFGVIRADGRDILLELEKILREKDGDIQANLDEIKAVFDTARSELLAVEPSMLKQLTKNVPALKRAMNFMSKDQQEKKEKKKKPRPWMIGLAPAHIQEYILLPRTGGMKVDANDQRASLFRDLGHMLRHHGPAGQGGLSGGPHRDDRAPVPVQLRRGLSVCLHAGEMPGPAQGGPAHPAQDRLPRPGGLRGAEHLLLPGRAVHPRPPPRP